MMSQTLHAETSARLCRDSSCELRSLHVKGANLRQQQTLSRANATSASSYRSATAHARVLPWLSHALAVSTTADAFCRSWNPPSASAFSLCITSIIFSLSAGCDSMMSSARPPECTVLSGVGRSTAHGGWPRPQRVRWTSPRTSRRCGWSQKWVQQMHDQLLRLLLCHLRRPCFVLVDYRDFCHAALTLRWRRGSCSAAASNGRPCSCGIASRSGPGTGGRTL